MSYKDDQFHSRTGLVPSLGYYTTSKKSKIALQPIFECFY
jgi:hypothetical protein